MVIPHPFDGTFWFPDSPPQCCRTLALCGDACCADGTRPLLPCLSAAYFVLFVPYADILARCSLLTLATVADAHVDVLCRRCLARCLVSASRSTGSTPLMSFSSAYHLPPILRMASRLFVPSQHIKTPAAVAYTGSPLRRHVTQRRPAACDAHADANASLYAHPRAHARGYARCRERCVAIYHATRQSVAVDTAYERFARTTLIYALHYAARLQLPPARHPPHTHRNTPHRRTHTTRTHASGREYSIINVKRSKTLCRTTFTFPPYPPYCRTRLRHAPF